MELTREDIRNACERVLVNKTLYVLPEALGPSWWWDGSKWHEGSNDSFWDFFESEMMLTIMKILTPEEAISIVFGDGLNNGAEEELL